MRSALSNNICDCILFRISHRILINRMILHGFWKTKIQ